MIVISVNVAFAFVEELDGYLSTAFAALHFVSPFSPWLGGNQHGSLPCYEMAFDCCP